MRSRTTGLRMCAHVRVRVAPRLQSGQAVVPSPPPAPCAPCTSAQTQLPGLSPHPQPTPRLTCMTPGPHSLICVRGSSLNSGPRLAVWNSQGSRTSWVGGQSSGAQGLESGWPHALKSRAHPMYGGRVRVEG